MPRAVQSDLFLYADDTCLVYSNKNASVVEERLNIYFNSLCDWFEDNKLSIHLGVDKTKVFCSLREERRKTYISIGETPQ